MKIRQMLHIFLGCALSLLALSAPADDTDVYLNPGSGLPAGSEPIVMFSLDYRPNLASTACQGYDPSTPGTSDCEVLRGYLPASGPYTYFDVLRGVLRLVFEPLEGVRVGLMLNHDHVNNCEGPGQTDCSNGGYIAMGPQLLMANDANGAKAQFHKILASIPTPQGNQSHAHQGKELFFELFRYLTGQAVYNGHNGWTDYSTDSAENLDVDGPDYAWDDTIETAGIYDSPLDTVGECTRIYTINPMFFVANQENDSDAAIEADVADGGLGVNVGNNAFDEVIAYLNDADLASGSYGSVADIDGKQNVTSYFIVDPTKINTTTIGYARAGGTGFPLPLSEDPGELISTLTDVFKQILSVSTTFVAASIPVNVFNRAEIVDNIYIALFQVDGDGAPSWPGNVKKLKLADIAGSPVLVDSLGAPAVAADGRIRSEGLTFWTDPGTLPAADADAGEVDGRDGRHVARGGAGQQIPGFVTGSPGATNLFGGRRIFYDSALGLSALNMTAAVASDLQTDLGAADAAEAAELIGFLRGLDVDDLDGDGNVSEAREWIFNDPLHSRPLPLNYGARGGYTTTNPAIYLAVASNDGLLHFIRNTTTGGTESGREAWAFAPRATMGAAKTLRANGVGMPHPYTVDGAPVAYIEDLNFNGTIEVGERAWVFVGLRRGGKSIYALDVSDPENPSLMWTIDKSGDFAELGYTFSTPRVGRVDLGSGPKPALIFAGGYDMNKDVRGAVGTDDTEGNAIFVVDGETGNLIWKARGAIGGSSSTIFEHAALVDSIPSPVTLGDTDGDLLTDRIIVGDSGGNVWRADIGGPDTSNWKLTRLAALGRHALAGKANDRRFFHRPDFVLAEDENGPFDAVVIGSGDRADPLDAGGITENFLYMIKDRNTAVGAGSDMNLLPSDLGDVTDNCLQEGGSCSVDLVHGWQLELETSGEKSLATPITIAGNVFFTTYVPGTSSATPCAPSEGQGRLYAVSLKYAASVINYETTDDDPSMPGEPTTKADRYTDLNSPGIPAEVVSVPPNMILRPDLQVDVLDFDTRWRTFWYLQEDEDL